MTRTNPELQIIDFKKELLIRQISQVMSRWFASWSLEALVNFQKACELVVELEPGAEANPFSSEPRTNVVNHYSGQNKEPFVLHGPSRATK